MNDRHYFSVDPKAIQEKYFTLDRDETHHLNNVLRIKSGATIWLIDGAGMGYRVTYAEIADGCAVGEINKSYKMLGELDTDIGLAFGLLKRERLELLIEKAVELGVTRLYPLVLDRSINRTFKSARIRKRIVNSSKQAGRSRLAVLHEPLSLEKWLNEVDRSAVLACHNSGAGSITNSYNHHLKSQPSLVVLIGPEGDLSQREMDLLKSKNIEFVSLGNRRLRSETAAIMALSILNECINRKGTTL